MHELEVLDAELSSIYPAATITVEGAWRGRKEGRRT